MTKVKQYVPDHRYASAPKIPDDRPPTREEVWAYQSHIYEGIKTEPEIVALARATWAGNYISWINFHFWDKQPDWTEGDPVIPAGVPPHPVTQTVRQYEFVKTFLDRSRRAA